MFPSDNESVVWLTEYRTFGFLIKRDAYTSLIAFSYEGIDYEEEVENDEYEYWEDHALDYETDEGDHAIDYEED